MAVFTQRQRSLLVSLAALLVMLALSALSNAGAAVQVYRLLQAELNGQSIGSAAYAAHSFMTLPLPGANTFKAILVVPLSLAAPDMLQGHLKQSGSMLEGMLLVLPRHYESGALSAEEAARLAAVEQLLLGEPVPVPLFFAVETPELQQAIEGTAAMLRRGVSPSATGERFELAIQGSPPAEVKVAQHVNYWALLSASEQQSKGVLVAPTVLVTAHYDTFSLAPGLPSLGTDSNGSGAVALMVLLRAFGRLYASADSRPPYNLLFLLTSGGPHGFEGARQWLNDADPDFLDKVQFVLALDSIGHPNDRGSLHLHYGPGPKGTTAEESAWHAALHGAAERMGLLLHDVAAATESERAREGEQAVAWAHEHFARRGLPAATLSARPQAPASPLRGGIGDFSNSSISSSSSSSSESSKASSRDGSSMASTSGSSSIDSSSGSTGSSSSSTGGSSSSSSSSPGGVDPAAVLAAAQLAGDAVASLVFPELERGLRLISVDGKDPGDEGSRSGQLSFVRSWLALFARSPRTLPLDQHLEAGEKLHMALGRFLREHASAYKRHGWEAAALPLRVWGGVTGTLQVYRAASVLFDMVLTACVVLYLAALFAAIRICTRGWADFEAMFKAATPVRRAGGNPPRSRKA